MIDWWCLLVFSVPAFVFSIFCETLLVYYNVKHFFFFFGFLKRIVVFCLTSKSRKGKKSVYRLNDTVASVSHGMMQQAILLWWRPFFAQLLRLSQSHCVLCFVFVLFCLYFWKNATHQTHTPKIQNGICKTINDIERWLDNLDCYILCPWILLLLVA